MRLSIVIPQYKEDDKMLRKLLNSVELQRQVDFNEIEVIFVNDCNIEYLPKEDIKSGYSFNIKVLMTEKNGGPGLARQYGLENASGDYILFLDADDYLISCLALRTIFNYKGNADILRGKFFNESGNVVDNGWTWVHGKFYKREYLLNCGIKFPPELRVNEDSYYNMLVTALTNKIEDCDEIITIWNKNMASITRTNASEFFVNSFGDFIKGKMLGFKVLKEKGLTEHLKVNLTHFLVYTYYYFQVIEFQNEKVQDLRNEYEKNIAKVLQMCYNTYRLITEDDINKMLCSEFKLFSTYKNYRLHETFDDYRERLHYKEI